jgi:hypothetical protein
VLLLLLRQLVDYNPEREQALVDEGSALQNKSARQ